MKKETELNKDHGYKEKGKIPVKFTKLYGPLEHNRQGCMD